MNITDMSVKPEKKTADVWDAVTDTTVENSSDTDKEFHLKTYILNGNDNSVGKTETEFTVKTGAAVIIRQSVLTYSPLLNNPSYRMVCELYNDGTLLDKQSVPLSFTV